jgi:hypothetical protein
VLRQAGCFEGVEVVGAAPEHPRDIEPATRDGLARVIGRVLDRQIDLVAVLADASAGSGFAARATGTAGAAGRRATARIVTTGRGFIGLTAPHCRRQRDHHQR